MTRFWRGLLRLPLYFVLGVATLWATGALYFDLPIAWLRAPVALIYVFFQRYFVAGVASSGVKG